MMENLLVTAFGGKIREHKASVSLSSQCNLESQWAPPWQWRQRGEMEGAKPCSAGRGWCKVASLQPVTVSMAASELLLRKLGERVTTSHPGTVRGVRRDGPSDPQERGWGKQAGQRPSPQS